MATSTSHQPFPSRPYTGLSRGGGAGGGTAGGQGGFQSSTTPYSAQAPFNAPSQNPGTFSGPVAQTQQQRDAQRLERERADLAERQRREAEERAAVEQVNEEQREEINEAFSLFDLDKDDHIDYHELKVALKALGFDVPKPELLHLLQTHGVPASTLQQQQQQQQHQPHTSRSRPSGSAQQQQQHQPTFSGPSRLVLSHAAFEAIAARKVLERDPREEILRAFELFDADGKGRIELGDLRRVARELGEGLQEEELVAMIEEFDVRGEGGIGREEFVGICLGG